MAQETLRHSNYTQANQNKAVISLIKKLPVVLEPYLQLPSESHSPDLTMNDNGHSSHYCVTG